MSLSNILIPNKYDIYANDATFTNVGVTDTLSTDTIDPQTANLVTINGNVLINGDITADNIIITFSDLIPAANNTYDIGSPAFQWKDLYIAGDANINNGIFTTSVETPAINSAGRIDLTPTTTIRCSTLTASQVVVTDINKDLTSLAYSTILTPDALVQRESITGNINVGSISCVQINASNHIVTAYTQDASGLGTGSIVTPGGASISKKLYIGTGIYLPTTGGTASELNFYEQTTHATTFSIGGGTSTSATIQLTRIGNIVTMTIPVKTFTSGGAAASSIASNTALPARYRPSANPTNTIASVWDNGSLFGNGMILILNNGILNIRKSSQANFTVSSSVGWADDLAVTFNLA